MGSCGWGVATQKDCRRVLSLTAKRPTPETLLTHRLGRTLGHLESVHGRLEGI